MPLSESILLLASLLFIGIIVSGVARRSPIPYTVILVIIGILLGQVSQNWPSLSVLHSFKLTPELVLFLFLPTLIFESGLKLNSRQLIKDLAPVLMLAIPALIISTSIIGIGLWYLLSINLLTALLFGALISATDPVAVTTIFQELGTPQRLTVLVEGESLLNDASAIVLFSILLGLAIAGDSHSFQLSHSIAQFFSVFFGGIAIGSLIGLIVCSLINRIEFSTAAIISLSMGAAYSTFIVVEHLLHLSGVMAVISCAIIFGLLASPKLSPQNNHTLAETWEFLAFIANTLLFLLVGLSVNITSLVDNATAILIAIALVLLARSMTVFSLIPMTVQLFKLPKISLGEQTILWWGGLKGGLAIAIVLSIPDSLAGKELLLSLTLGVVVFTLLVNAPSMRPLMNKLGLNDMDDHEQAEIQHGIELVRQDANQLLDDFLAVKVLSQQSFTVVSQNTQHLFDVSLPKKSTKNHLRLIRLNLLQVENNMLNLLYHQGMMKQYTFLDLQGELNRKKEHLLHNQTSSVSSSTLARQANLFLKLEDLLLAKLREHDFATSLLVYIQNRRIGQHLIKDICSVFMTQAAVSELSKINSLNHQEKKALYETYQQRIDMFGGRITDTQKTYPVFYTQFEQRFSHRTALNGALNSVENKLHNKIVGGKAYNYIKQFIEQAIANVEAISDPIQEGNSVKLIRQSRLFSDLPAPIIEQLSQQAKSITFLADDIVIKQGDHGSALYIIAHGQFSVYRSENNGDEKQLAILTDGDLFGEIGLLGSEKRTATVKALEEASLLRFTKQTIIKLAQQFPHIDEQLKSAHKNN